MNRKQNDPQKYTHPGASEHWPDISRLWELVGPPLRPCAQDIGFVVDAMGSEKRSDHPLRALIMGVTPELFFLPWPENATVLASDHTLAMIDAVWPGPRNAAICSRWTSLPLQSGSCDVILCDGGIHLMAYPDDHWQLVRSLHRVLSKNGLCIFRLFVPPQKPETARDVLKDLVEGKISNLNLLKLRLGMAMQVNAAQGVELGRVWKMIHQAVPDFTRLAEKTGWPVDHLNVIHTYRNSPIRYYFMTVSDLRQLFCRNPGGFEFEKLYSPAYALGERCPTVVFRRTGLGPQKRS